jgi:hypothetical protein
MIKIMRIIGFLLLSCIGITSLAAGTGAMPLNVEHHVVVHASDFYTVKVSYPAISGENGQAFNAAIKNLVTNLTNNFTKDLQSPEQLNKNASASSIKLDNNSNELDISYKVMYNRDSKVSLRFTYFMSYFMSAHPVTLYQTFTYNVAQNKELQLSDMFKPGADYLTVLSNYCQQQLLAKLTANNKSDAQQISAGAGPKQENYMLWNIVPKGLLISFNPYTVAAGYVGVQQVLVPSSVLQPLQ